MRGRGVAHLDLSVSLSLCLSVSVSLLSVAPSLSRSRSFSLAMPPYLSVARGAAELCPQIFRSSGSGLRGSDFEFWDSKV